MLIKKKQQNMMVLTAGGDHPRGLGRPGRKVLQRQGLVVEVLLAIGRALGRQHGLGELLQRRGDVDEVLDDARHHSLLDLVLELVELLRQLPSDLLGAGTVALAAGAQVAQLVGQAVDLVAELEDLGLVDAG